MHKCVIMFDYGENVITFRLSEQYIQSIRDLRTCLFASHCIFDFRILSLNLVNIFKLTLDVDTLAEIRNS